MKKAALLVSTIAAGFTLFAGEVKSPLTTTWGEKVTPENAWREYPRPQMVRENWTCLNGRWDYAVVSNDADGCAHKVSEGKILVPFPIESALSGVGRPTGRDELIEYRRTFEVKAKEGCRQILRFDGVDYRAQVFVNGVEAGVPHEGAFTGFSYDVTDLVKDGANDLMVRVWDPTEGFVNPLGKQSCDPKGCFYTRVSGIWQTVWMETVPETYVESYNVVPDIDRGVVTVTVNARGKLGDVSGGILVWSPGCSFSMPLTSRSFDSADKPIEIKIPGDLKLWSPEDPALYGIAIELKTGAGWFGCDTCDKVWGHFAMRKFEKRKDAKGVLRFFLNNQPYFIVGALDQGWWPDGLLTPPSEEAMRHDIQTLKNCGFNMMRKHIKVEPLRYYALCDRIGLLVLQDMPSGDAKTMFDFAHANVAYGTMRREWQAMMDKLMNVPSIVMWIPYNEQWTQPGEALTADTLRWTKRYDPTRLVDGPSGWRDYEGGDSGHNEKCRAWSKHRPEGEEEPCDAIDRHDYGARPTMHAVNSHRVSFLGEFGGIGCRVDGHLWTTNAWGYGDTGGDTDRKAFEKKYVELMTHVATLAEKGLGGSVYTQTTDVEGEINGLMTYDRKVLKFDPKVLKAAHDLLRAAADGRCAAALYRRLADECRPVASKLTVAEVVAPAGDLSVRRVFREARVTRGNTNIMKVQPIDDAAWVWMPGDGGTDTAFLKFRNEFEVKEGEGPLTIDVSADERYRLTCDGAFVSRGPNRSTVENWQYNTYEIDLKPGRHVLEATVWKTCGSAPLAQLSWRGGFILKANEAYNQRLTTGVAKWKVGKLSGIEPAGADNNVWGTGSQWQITGSGIVAAEPKSRSDAEVVRGFAGTKGPRIFGGRTNGWMLFPSQIPDQTETVVRPGRVVAVTREAAWRESHVYTEREAKETVDLSKPVTVPAKTKMQLAWDLGRYICAYPVLKMKGAKGARVSWTWTEATQRAADDLKGGEEGARDAIVGRYLNGYGDIFVCDGEREGAFTTPWFRCGKWCRLDIETGDEPLEIADIHLVESRYPLEMESAFASKDDASLEGIRRISARAMQMCCHEMLFDCPYYEQQMYPGDTRVQLNVISAMTRDDRIIRRAIELYDLGTRDDGQCPFNWPTRGTQEGATYTLCYLLMYGDYAMNHADRDWLRARLPGLRKSMSGMEIYENADGLLENLPGWQFMDWVVGWDDAGTAPGGRFGEGVNAEANLFWVLAMQSAATTERALGNELQAQYWEAKAAKLKAKIVETFWCEERGLLADTPAKTDFSEHAQSLALLGDVLPEDKAKTCFGHLVSDADLRRTTVYFSYYLFETYFKFGRGDLFLKRLDLWRDYVKKGLTTTQEAPDWTDANGKSYESRSDCHAWGAHPIWFMQTGLAGIRSAAPFFSKVRVAPCPGSLAELKARHPHPQGFVEVDLRFADGKASGTVKTPVAGTFEFGGRTVPLVAGENAIK